MNRVPTLCGIASFLLLFTCQSVPAADEHPYQCVYSPTAISIDGEANDVTWDSAIPLSLKLPITGLKPKAPTQVRLAWDLDYFYFFAEMKDNEIIADKTEHDDSLWLEDVFELFLRPSNNHEGYYEFQVNPLGTKLDIYWPKASGQSEAFVKQLKSNQFKFDVVTTTSKQNSSWAVEGRIRWRDLMMTGGRPAADEIWTFALCRYDYLSEQEPELSSSATLTEANFHKHDDYSEIIFLRPTALQTDSHVSDSRVIGAPTPPPPYKAIRKYESLELKNPIFLALEPGTNDLIAITQDNPDGKCRVVRVDRETRELTEMFRLKDLAYNLCFHPDYENNGQLFVGTNDASGADSNGYVRRFTINNGIAEPDSHKLIVQWPSNGHNGAAVTFGHDGMLYVTTGDGTSDSDDNIAGQQLDHLLAKLLRLDVDSADPSVGYIVPKDNPFVGREGTAPETYAYGLRNPWRMTTDSKTGQIWIGNNGQDLWEQVYLVQPGANWGWSVYEGSQPFYLERKLGPDPHTKPTFEHAHSEARSLTGGIVYHGDKYPDLTGAYIYGDYSTGKIWAGRHNGKRVVWHKEIADSQLAIACFLEDADGDILVLDYQNGGEINKLVPNDQMDYSKSFPRKLSDSGIFENVADYRLKQGAIPYDVNSPLWSDGSLKTRHIVLTKADDKIDVTDIGPWNFPEQTVIVKSFSIEMKDGDTNSSRRIETRFLTKQDNEWVGYSYRWNKAQTDAFLVPDEGREEEFRIETDNGIKIQKWKYPSRSECMMCHARAAKYVLGLQTAQLNRDFDYSGHLENQLSYLQRTGRLTVNTKPQHATFAQQQEFLNSFDTENAAAVAATAKAEPQQRATVNDGLFAYGAEGTPRLSHINDETASLETRARSYIYSNCAQCHVGAGGGNSQMHFEWSRTLSDMKVVGVTPLHGLKGIADGQLITPGKPESSVLLKRMAIRGTGQMPIIATHQVDTDAVEVIRQWILSIPEQDKAEP